VSPRRRAVVLLALAAVLGLLAASDVSRREAALRRRLGPDVAVVVARTSLPAGAPLSPARLAVRRVPARYAPARAFRRAAQVLGLRATVAIPAGADLQPELVGIGGAAAAAAAPAMAPGERAVQIVAAGSTRDVHPGSRVDIVITRDVAGATGAGRATTIDDVEVLTVAAASSDDPGPHVSVELRVGHDEGVELAAAQDFARDIRLLVRPPGVS
jgi:pilus assembly protein CpaB